MTVLVYGFDRNTLGVHGNFKHPDVNAAIESIFKDSKAAGTIAGMYVGASTDIPDWHAKGARLFVVSIDYKLIGAALAKTRKSCREAVAKLEASATVARAHSAN